MSTLGRQMSRSQRRDMNNAVIESNYKTGRLLAPLTFKADDEDEGMLKPVRFEGFANTGKADLGGDIVDPRAFTRATLQEFLKFGRQLLFMHNPWTQVGEITDAETVLRGTRSMFGIVDGGLKVKGFVDSPVDEELGIIPDHEIAKVIHAARMQVRRGRLKLLSIGWRPTKTEIIKAKDPRRGNDEFSFRLVKSLILSEISLVTMAMNPQSMVELRKAYEGQYGEEIASALFCEDATCTEILDAIPENTTDFTHEDLKRLLNESMAKAAQLSGKVESKEIEEPSNEADAQKLNLVHLDGFGNPEKKYQIVHL